MLLELLVVPLKPPFVAPAAVLNALLVDPSRSTVVLSAESLDVLLAPSPASLLVWSPVKLL